ncbi:hypothetical protein IU447_11795 [Nocardia farcinica]|uniref:hypothetical protein n=1 Tax=Nocardia farcinica TaxID=37329 RepID=UPI001893A682|nr:hypothetical protein [Nocardia farcinica]MBF6360799.1 hypothetical protein [Nocardia farcinica]MBF6386860.1 hypothetical protein [Nocardia farcinica]
MQTEAFAECRVRGPGVEWSGDRLVVVDETGAPLRPERYIDELQRIAKAAGLRGIQLEGRRNSSVSLMLALGIPVHISAAWHRHDPSMSLSVYSVVQGCGLGSGGTAAFG